MYKWTWETTQFYTYVQNKVKEQRFYYLTWPVYIFNNLDRYHSSTLQRYVIYLYGNVFRLLWMQIVINSSMSTINKTTYWQYVNVCISYATLSNLQPQNWSMFVSVALCTWNYCTLIVSINCNNRFW
jgi:hypothetical protein